MRYLILAIVFLLSLRLQAQSTHIVTNTNDSGAGSLRAMADSCVSGDTIRISPSLIANGSDSIVLTSGEINLDGISVSIIGVYNSLDTLFVSGNQISRIFSFTSASRVVIDSMVLINGNSNGWYGGGAFYCSNCSDSLIIKNSVIERCSANKGGGFSSYNSSSVTLENSIISSNVVTSDGGGIYISSSSTYLPPSAFPSPKIIIKNSEVANNLAAGYGGGIYSIADTSSITVENSKISSNEALRGGGIHSYSVFYSSSPSLFSNRSVVNIIGSNITNNTAVQSGILCSGGGIYSYANSRFHTPTSPYFPSSSVINLTDSYISGNSAGSFGGGINSDADTVLMDVVNSEINNNLASNSGGGIRAEASFYSKINVTNSTVIGNIINGSASVGGGICSITSPLHSSFINNYTPSFVTIENSTISDNVSSTSGGGIYSNSTSSSSIVTIKKSTISGNQGVYFGGGVHSYGLDSSNVSVSKSTIAENIIGGTSPTIPGKGGGIYSYCDSSTPNSLVNITNSTICDNSARTSGSGIYASCPSDSNKSIITVSGSVIAKNGSSGHGILNSNNLTTISSSGYNAFGGLPLGKIFSDSIYMNQSVLRLKPLALNGGTTKILEPSLGSILIDKGNPHDVSDAQNSPVIGVRDIGAAERCSSLYKDSLVVCDSVTWIDGVTYYSNNDISQVKLLNSYGCDSLISLDLKVYHSYYTDTIMACDSITWINGITYFSSNNTAVHTYVNPAGCTSVAKLDLTIVNSSHVVDLITACDSLTWINGVTYYSSNNTATDTLINMVGCDSVITLNLTIETLDSSVVQNLDTLSAVEDSASYQWIDCLTNQIVPGATSQYFIPESSSSYKVEISKGFCIDTSECFFVNACNNQANFNYVELSPGYIGFADYSIGNYTQLNWSFGDGSDTTIQHPYHLYQTNGNYVVVLAINDSLADNSCVSYFLDTISITGLNTSVVCQAGFSVYYDSVSGNVNVVNSSIGSNLRYAWDFGDGNSSTLQFPMHTYSGNGPYNLCLTIDDGNGCTDTYCDSVSNLGVWFRNVGFQLWIGGAWPTSISHVSLPNNINIYPNPVRDQVNIEITDWPSNEVNIVVRDVSGKVIFEQEVEPVSNKEIVTINTSNWAKGTYFIKVESEENRVVEQIVVQ